MRLTFLGIVILGLSLGVTVSLAARHPGKMLGGGMMGGGEVVEKKTSSVQATEGALSTYTNLCASCHGATGKGNGAAAATLNPRPKDFTDCKAMAHESDATLFKIIKEGGASVGHSPMMPPWGGVLRDQQIQELVEYIHGLCKK